LPRSTAHLSQQDDKLREECGIMAIYGTPEAARKVYLGLYALQHRGQESAGIASARTAMRCPTSRAWAW
jgi:glutamine phosphoribosylpyrophosphate amidotransferase